MENADRDQVRETWRMLIETKVRETWRMLIETR